MVRAWGARWNSKTRSTPRDFRMSRMIAEGAMLLVGFTAVTIFLDLCFAWFIR